MDTFIPGLKIRVVPRLFVPYGRRVFHFSKKREKEVRL
jgi:hypothetical protein